MNDTQKTVAGAYRDVFADSGQVTLVLDDLTSMARGLPLEHQAGAFQILMHILTKRSALRRERVRGKEA